MNKPSERIVVFVTPAQKRAIAASAENLGISVSELMRRAVLSFGATSEQVKAASIVDRLRAPREPDALNAALQRVARSVKHTQAALPAGLQAKGVAGAHAVGGQPAQTDDAAHAALAEKPLLPAGAREALANAALNSEESDAQAAAPATAANTAANTATPAEAAPTPRATPQRSRVEIGTAQDGPGPHIDPATGDGHFA